MKTSHLLSTFAAVCIFLTLIAAPVAHISISDLKATQENYRVNAMQPTYNVELASIEIKTIAKPISLTEDNMEQCKFDVNQYVSEDATNTDLIEMPVNETQTNQDFLKFDVTKYIGEIVSSSDLIELSMSNNSNFEYLKFDISDYINTNTTNTDLIEMPQDKSDNSKLGYLKFDVSKYINTDALENAEFGDLPIK